MPELAYCDNPVCGQFFAEMDEAYTSEYRASQRVQRGGVLVFVGGVLYLIGSVVLRNTLKNQN